MYNCWTKLIIGLVLLHSLFLDTGYASYVSSAKIQQQICELDEQIEPLPVTYPHVIPWTMGYLSLPLERAEEEIAVEIELDRAAAVDLLVIMPAGISMNGSQLQPFGFPRRFFIERLFADGSSEIIADHRSADYSISGIEPQLFPFRDKRLITGVRITTTLAPPVQSIALWGYQIALSEVLLFEGEKNVALNSTVKASSIKWAPPVWCPEYLVDGFTQFAPLDQRAPTGVTDIRFRSEGVVLLYDMGEARPVDELRLWPARSMLAFAHPVYRGSGFPKTIKLEALETPEDLNSHLLLQVDSLPFAPRSGPWMRALAPTTARFLRLTLSHGEGDAPGDINFGLWLNEIEFLHRGVSVAHQLICEQTAINPLKEKKLDVGLLTDGLVTDGHILPLRRWTEEYALKVKLERQRAALEAQLPTVRAGEKIRQRVFSALALVLILGLALGIWLVRLLSRQRSSQMREQIACDLHDELGANLSSISHSSELAKELAPAEDQMLNSLLGDITEAAKLSAGETQQFIQFLDERHSGMHTSNHIRAIARQVLATLRYQCTFDEAARSTMDRLLPIQKWDLLFFIKESLNNIIKHANADHVEILITVRASKLIVMIYDNGQGIAEHRLPPRHLALRAKRLKGTMRINSSPGNGTRITLTLNRRSCPWRKRST